MKFIERIQAFRLMVLTVVAIYGNDWREPPPILSTVKWATFARPVNFGPILEKKKLIYKTTQNWLELQGVPKVRLYL